MRVGSISQRHALGRANELTSARGVRILFAEVPADGYVVSCRHLERLERESAPESSADISVSLLPRLYKVGVIGGIRKHRDALVVLGRCTQQRDPADVDLLNGVRERAAGSCDG